MTTELRHLHAFRAAAAEPDDDARAAARAALLAEIEAAAQQASPAAAGVAAGRTRARRGLLPSLPRTRVASSVALGTLAVVAAAVAIAIGTSPDAGDERSLPAAQTAPATVAASSLAPRDAEPGPAQWWYQRQENFGPRGEADLNVREDWHSRDGGWRAIQRGSRPLEQDQAPRPGSRPRYTFFPAPLSYEEASALPADPELLYTRILAAAEVWARQGGTAPVEHEALTIVGDWLRASPPLPAWLRAGLWQAATQLRGVETLGTVRDRRGREGVGIARAEAGQRRELIFDRESAWLLEERTVDLRSGRTRWSTTYVASGVVDSVRARP
jgi:hypothetical protein